MKFFQKRFFLIIFRFLRWYIWHWKCAYFDHKWYNDGGRKCPKGETDCSQTVYRCERCGDWDYGYQGGPAYKECFIDCEIDACRGSAESVEDWHRRYKQCLIDQSGIAEKEAQCCLDASMGEYDYHEEPEDAAFSEMSYWTD